MNVVERPCTICGADQPKQLMLDGDTAYQECGRCQAIYASPFPVSYEDVNEAAYVEVIDKYKAKVEKRLAANKKRLRQFERYRGRAVDGGQFLEIGCNTGATLLAAQQLGWQVTGVDISQAATAFARDSLGLNALTTTLEEADLPPDHYDLVYSNAVLEHIEAPLQTLKAARRVLKPNGMFYAATVNWDSYTRRFLGEHWRYLDPKHHVQLYTPANVHTLAEHAGFQVERIWTNGVRFEDKKRGKAYSAPLPHRWGKGLYSLATRFNRRGDSIKFLLRKT